jgi:hypothetical protein
MAREVLNLAWSLRTGRWSSPLVQAAQKALSYYVVAEHFSAVALEASASNSVYSTGTMYAHGFVMFLPKKWVAGALKRGGGEARLASSSSLEDAETLTQDGISLFDARATTPTHPCVGCFGGPPSRARHVEAIGLEYYMFQSCCMLMRGELVSAQHGTPVYELAYFTGERYGATYEATLGQSDAVALKPTACLTPAEHALALRCAACFHPLTRFDVDASADDAATPLSAVAPRVDKGPADAETHYFLQAADCEDEAFLATLASKGRRLTHVLDFFADGFYTAQVFESPV